MPLKELLSQHLMVIDWDFSEIELRHLANLPPDHPIRVIVLDEKAEGELIDKVKQEEVKLIDGFFRLQVLEQLKEARKPKPIPEHEMVLPEPKKAWKSDKWYAKYEKRRK
jgi:hypothetical protein